MKFEIDTTLKRGVEFSLKTYVNGIDKGVELVDDFYKEYELQDYWFMNERTGLHVNIGVNYKAKWNIFKGLLLIADKDFVFKDMEWRKISSYTKSLLPKIKEEIDSNKEIITKNVNYNDLEGLREYFNKLLFEIWGKQEYKKAFGFNFTHIPDLNYVEFRYPGGDISREVLIDKLYYFCYIVYAMVDDKFKRKSYLKKLYKFLSD